MSMYDMSYCSCDCPQEDCERNLKFHKPETRFYSVTTFDEDTLDKTHKNCPWKYTGGKKHEK